VSDVDHSLMKRVIITAQHPPCLSVCLSVTTLEIHSHRHLIDSQLGYVWCSRIKDHFPFVRTQHVHPCWNL